MASEEQATTGASEDTAQEPNVSSINLKLPAFYPSDPALWFGQVENLFLTRRITSQKSKFAYIVSSLQPDVAQEVRDKLLNPPTQNPNDTIKAELIRRTSASEQKRLRQLLISKELGDRKPTQLLRRMHQLLGDRQLESSILKQLFVQRLPTNVQLILASLSDTVDIESLATIADKIVEANPTQTPVTCCCCHSTDTVALHELVSKLTLQVQELTTKVSELSTHHSRGRSRSPRRCSHSRSRPRSSSSSRQALCWYHARHGDNAVKCKPPCNYTTSSNKSNDSASN
ncbi:hypothetical protein HOLleu_10849 [Holothuria leucospilota]|uniref:DUF7041 domain-containing protein n=1 Tax=Holothuria leucospilota TaxID=206669 RepID=A0A9Q1CFD8_HOLLE|nr:hypothetical protein HOLleu_10849 [Holothuria leucospilota]